ncbi:Protein of unknown function [Prosthecobacter debontii]|uniref:DUF4058 domain-containing protein n=1 Tax=Prosthecobacter debontii TaxID=48467 RepID=A0A1T4Y0A7_9BACT|nr:DUF4058 family protein [Prosthecobacter debontii]SKA95267.1 Protein of unknown function [Prosthecobacter debontii]
MSLENPFPGMNPWLQGHWRDFHAAFLVYARDVLNDALPSGMHARIDERLAISDENLSAATRSYIPDVSITQSWDRPAASVAASGVAVAEPVIVEAPELNVEPETEVEHFIEIVHSRAHVITAIELISPSNKDSRETQAAWQRKRRDYLLGGISVVEIDLIRGGPSLLPSLGQSSSRVSHSACITRAAHSRRHGLYDMPLRQPLPIIRIPLREGDDDTSLNLQAIVNQCYRKGRYHEVLDYTVPPQPPLPDEEMTWATELLKQAALI